MAWDNNVVPFEQLSTTRPQKSLPYNKDAEQSVVGGLMLDNSAWDSIEPLVNANDFFIDDNRKIFTAISALAYNGAPFDVITIADQFERDGVSIDLSYVAMLAKDTPSAANIVNYAKIVKEKALLRKAIKLSDEIKETADTGDLSAVIEKVATSLADIQESTVTDSNEAQDWINNISGGIDYIIPFDCEARDIQQWIMTTSQKKQPALAFLSAYSVLATLIGRSYIQSGIKGNLISIGLLESGMGKDWIMKSTKRLLSACGMDEAINDELASGAALFEAVSEAPDHNCFVCVDEVGHYFQSIKTGGNQFSKEVLPMITKMYTSPADTYTGKRKLGSGIPRIERPNLCFLGMSTEGQIMDSMRTSELADGSLARFVVFFGDNSIELEDIDFNPEVPEYLSEKLNSLKNYTAGRSCLGEIKINVSEKFKAEQKRLKMYFDRMALDIANGGTSKAKFAPFYRRLYVRAMHISILTDQCKDEKVLTWAADIVEKSNEILIKKFMHLSSDNETEKYAKLIEKAIKESGKKGIIHKDLINSTKLVPTRTRNEYLKELEDSGVIFTEKLRIKGSQKPSTKYFWKK